MATDANAERLRLLGGSPERSQPADREAAGKGTAPSSPGNTKPGGQKSEDPTRLPAGAGAPPNTRQGIHQPVPLGAGASELAEKASPKPPAHETKALEIEAVVQLATRAKEGDDEAFNILYLHYLGPIYKYFRVRGYTREEAEDLTEETFFRVVARIGGCNPRTFIRWLYRIARNLRIDDIRHMNRVRDQLGNRAAADISEIVHPRLTVPSHEEEVTDNISKHDALYKALSTLKGEQKKVAELKLAELSNPEIAAALKKKVDAVKKTWERARENLREELERLHYVRGEE